MLGTDLHDEIARPHGIARRPGFLQYIPIGFSQ
jgi:hypothetical protein